MPPEHGLLWTAFAGILGLLVGSFLNVCIFRLPRECMSIVRPRSRCPTCLFPIAWYDNIPVASWIALRGRCRRCRAPISPRYALVELMTGLIFAGAATAQIFHGEGRPAFERIVEFALQAYLSAALIVCTFIDLDFTILPDEVTLSGLIAGLAAGAAFPFIHERPVGAEALGWLAAEPALREHVSGLMTAAAGAFVGGGVIYAVGVFGKLVFRKEAMGFGDVKFMAFLGAFLGPDGVLIAIFVSVLAGALFGMGKWVAVRRMGYVPFGPFLAAGAAAVLFADRPIRAAILWYLEWVRGGPG
ncbi:MAG: prepilin peptidase [Planctomycetes bacterium]|nr:prepilin peptidase [Planctomycetota bacterium]